MAKRNERGVVMLILLGTIVSFLALLALTLDAGNLYRGKLRLQRALDAAAIGGIYLVGQGPSDSTISNVAMQIAQDNMAGSGVSNLNISAAVNAGLVTVQGSAQFSTLLLRSIPGFPALTQTGGIASAATTRSAVSLVVDLTGSMNCPASGECCPVGGCQQSRCAEWNRRRTTCLRWETVTINNCWATATCATPTKLDKLKEAASAFVNQFNESLDQLALVGFNTTATVKKAMRTPFSKATLTGTIIPALTAANGTNIQAGITTGNAQLALADTNFVTLKAMVLITDGAPNYSDPNSPSCGINDNRQHYIKAIAAADAVRAGRASFYTVGLGHPSPDTSDAYQMQNDPDSLYLKSFLLGRSTNAESAAGNPSFDCVPSYHIYNLTPGISKGLYLETPDANQLQAMLLTIAKSIKARMMQ